MTKETEGLKLVVASTGASGVSLVQKFLKVLLKVKEIEKIFFVSSDAFEDVLSMEEGQSFSDFQKLFSKEKKVVFFDGDDISAPISSGSFQHDGMVILPLSMSSLGAIATGAHRNLAHRAADVCLKEGRDLIICPRETPFSLIHLRNLCAIKEAGATVLPFIPAYYTRPKTIADLENHFFQKILDHLNLENKISPRWGS